MSKDFLKQFEEKLNRPSVEDTHKRATFLIEKEILERLNKVTDNQPKGFKTAFVNEALRRMLDEFENR